MDAEKLPVCLPLGRGSMPLWISRNHETLKSTPAGSDTEKFHSVDHIEQALAGPGFKYDAEKSRSAEEITLPKGMAGMVMRDGALAKLRFGLETIRLAQGHSLHGTLIL